MVCYRRPPSSPHIHSARTAQDGSRKRYSHTSIKNHATVSQAALSNFDRQITITHIRSHADEKSLVETETIESNDVLKRESRCSRLTPEIWSSAFYPLRRARLSDWFLTRFVLSSDTAITISFCSSSLLSLSLSFFFFLFGEKFQTRWILATREREHWRKWGKKINQNNVVTFRF